MQNYLEAMDEERARTIRLLTTYLLLIELTDQD